MHSLSQMDISIRNFQIIEKADLVIKQGLTVLIGPSNTGKTSIFRALESAFYNKSSDVHVRAGQKACLVKFTFGNHTFYFRRDLSKASKVSYAVDGQVFEKPGRSPLDVIGDKFHIKEVQILNSKERLNFWKQMKFPFLLDRTGSQLFEFLSFSDTRLINIGRKMKDDYKNMEKERDILIIKIDTNNENRENMRAKLVKYASLPSLRKALDKLRIPVVKYASLEQGLLTYSDLLKKSLVAEDKLNKLNSLKDIDISPVSKLIVFISNLSHKLEVFSTLEARRARVTEQLRVQEQSIERFDLSFIHTDLSQLTVLERDLDKFRKEMTTYSGFLVKIRGLKATKEETELVLEGVKEDLEEFKICPLCGSELEGA